MDIITDEKLAALRNPEGIWINTKPFRQEGLNFMKNGYYSPDPWGSPDWFDYWTRERERCLTGYSVGGARITGDHYSYLNYSPIQRVEDTQATISDKIKGFPDFWDGDYNYFWVREIARKGILRALGVELTDKELESFEDGVVHVDTEEQAQILKGYLDTLFLEVKIVPTALTGGYDLIVGKARRKGYSYKNASIAATNFIHRPNSYTMFMAYEKKYLFPKGIFNMAQDTINFINTNTAWIQPSDVINKQDHIRASYIEYVRGIKLEKGYKSEIQALSFKDNPNAGRGKDAYDIFGEEVGAWGVPGGLKATQSAMKPSVTAGNIKTGMMTYFGTSGETDKGTVDFADMHHRPEAFGFLPFNDVWGKIPEKVEGFFHPNHWNMEGFYDKNGNSDLDGAKLAELRHRDKLIESGATSTEIQARMQEHSLDSAEAFSLIADNDFPVVELKAQLEKVKAHKLQNIKGTPVKLHYREGKCVATPILDGTAKPIQSYKDIPIDKRGCPIIYEAPIPNAERGLYKIGYDPVRQEKGVSLAAIIVYKSVHAGSLYHDVIVAEYIGRLETPDDIDHLLEMFCDLYNTTAMHENEVTGVKNYFRRIKRLGLLAAQPDTVISKNIKKSTVARVLGCHMNDQLKEAGERYTKQWLLTVLDYDENGDQIRTIDRIYSIRLLEELISYHRKGNFDLVSALFMCLFQVQEEKLGKEYDKTSGVHNTANKLVEQIKKMHGGKRKLQFAGNF